MARTRGNARLPGDRAGGETSLDAAMRAPSTTTPDVVVIDHIEEDVIEPEIPDPSKDLWISTVDGRYNSAIIPVRVGPHAETFPVHRDVLTKSEYFRKALDGEFKEAADQAIDLPEEDPDIFSFVVAYLYEEKFVPIKSMASVMVTEPDKGKARVDDDDSNSGSNDATDSIGSASDDSAINRRRRRRTERRAWEQDRRKQAGRHRPSCNCPACVNEHVGPPCWSCGATRRPPPPRNRYGPPPRPQPEIVHPHRFPRHHLPRPRDRHHRHASHHNMVTEEPASDERMSQEDMRTWSLTYSLSLDVYVCAERYLMQDFKSCIAAFIINSFEVAGVEAAVPAVLQSCKILQDGVSPMDPLLKKVFARVGFLQSRMWKNFAEETHGFFQDNPELALSIMREMVERRDDKFENLPPMEHSAPFLTMSPEDMMIQGPGPRRRYVYD